MNAQKDNDCEMNSQRDNDCGCTAIILVYSRKVIRPLSLCPLVYSICANSGSEHSK